MLSAEALLQIWERGQQCGPADRALRLLALALPDHDSEMLASVDLGLRDWHLLRLRLAWFGSEVAGYADCPSCGERLEIELDARGIGDQCLPEAPSYVSQDGRRFRLPNGSDLVSVAGVPDRDAAARQLLARCSIDGLPADDESSSLFDEVDAGLAALAAERGIHVNVSCAICGARTRHAVDAAEFLWIEIATHAAVLVDDVDRLARAYGWSEREILAMTAARRGAYLNRVDR